MRPGVSSNGDVVELPCAYRDSPGDSDIQRTSDTHGEVRLTESWKCRLGGKTWERLEIYFCRTDMRRSNKHMGRHGQFSRTPLNLCSEQKLLNPKTRETGTEVTLSILSTDIGGDSQMFAAAAVDRLAQALPLAFGSSARRLDCR